MTNSSGSKPLSIALTRPAQSFSALRLVAPSVTLINMIRSPSGTFIAYMPSSITARTTMMLTDRPP